MLKCLAFTWKRDSVTKHIFETYVRTIEPIPTWVGGGQCAKCLITQLKFRY